MDFQYGNNYDQTNANSDLYNNYNAKGTRSDFIPNESSAIQELSKIPEGKAFQGEIVNVSNNRVSIRLDNGQTLQGTMKEQMNFSIGDKVLFQVKSKDGGVIEIKPVTDGAIAQNMTAKKALEAANIPMNEKTSEMMKCLLEQQMSIDKKSLTDVYKQLLANPDADTKTIVEMMKLKIPVNEANIGQFEAYKNYEHRIAQSVTNLAQQLPEVLDELCRDNPQLAREFHGKILELFPLLKENVTIQLPGEQTVFLTEAGTAFGDMEPGKSSPGVNTDMQPGVNTQVDAALLSEEQKQVSTKGLADALTENRQSDISTQPDNQTVTPQGRELLIDEMQTQPNTKGALPADLPEKFGIDRYALLEQLEGLKLPEDLKQKILFGSIGVNELNTELEKIFSQTEWTDELEKQVFGGSEYKKLLANRITNQWFVRPEELLAKQGMEDFYEKLRQTAVGVEKLLEQTGHIDSAAGRTSTGIRENVDFMNQMNQMFTYIQLPLKMAGQNAHSDLYVFTNKKSLKEKNGKISALLHLDMDALKSMDIYVEMLDQNINIKFEMEEQSARLFQDNISLLEDRIKSRGYTVSTEFEPRKKEFGFVEDFLEKEHDSNPMQRYSFDVRV